MLTDSKESKKQKVCIQGLGFVGSAMAVAVAIAKDSSGFPLFDVTGVDLSTPEGLSRIQKINKGDFPFVTSDKKLIDATRQAFTQGNLSATTDPNIYSSAQIIVVDVHLDLFNGQKEPKISMESFKKAICIIGENLSPGTLVIIETTVPPGTCEKIIVPELTRVLKKRGLSSEDFLLAHSYERVMPGSHYLDSIINFWRVYSGHTSASAEACAEFFSKVINVKDFPLTRLASTTASETAKVLENSYRATTIAFMEEWGRFAEAVGIDLFEVVDAIRQRPTHSNMRYPGFGVGGYCLTKDPLFTPIVAKELFNFSDLDFPFSTRAVSFNKMMPLVTLRKIESILGTLLGKKLLLLGVSYRQDIGDTRFSPSQIFVESAEKSGAEIICHDPLVNYWPELDRVVLSDLPLVSDFDTIVFAVSHPNYSKINFAELFKGKKILVFDANNVLTKKQRQEIRSIGCTIESIGRGKGL